MSERDPLRRRSLIYVRVGVRLRRRVVALLAYLDRHPDTTRATGDEIRRLDDLVGEAERLRRAL